MSNPDQPMDHVPPDDGVARDEPSDIEKNVKEKSTWMRLLFMILIGFAGSVAMFITGAVVVVNFFYVLFTGKANDRLTPLGHAMANYMYQIIQYMTFNSEVRPFPLDAEWPGSETLEKPAESSDE